MSDLRSRGATLVAVDGGNCLFPRRRLRPEDRELLLRKARTVIRAHNLVGLDAMAVGAYDLAAGLDELLRLRTLARFPFLCANLVDRERKGTVFPPYHIVKRDGWRVGLIGVVDQLQAREALPPGDRYAVEPVWSAVKRLAPELRAEGCDVVVVLSALDPKRMRVLARSISGIQIFIAGDPRNKLRLPWHLGDSWILGGSQMGKFVGLAAVDREPGKKPTVRQRYVPMRPDYPEVPAVRREVDAYYRLVGAAQAAGIPVRDDELDTNLKLSRPVYVSDEVCRRCHPAHHKAWARGPHAGALGRLAAPERGKPGCVRCHVTGYGAYGGFSDGAGAPDLSGVQCEACHGPGSLHPAAPIPRAREAAEAACAGCHTRERSPGFRLRSALERIPCTRLGPEVRLDRAVRGLAGD